MSILTPVIASSGALLMTAASGPAAISVEDVAAYERVEFRGGPAVITAMIVEDTRCSRQDLCFRDNQLIIGVVVFEEGRWRDALLPMGVEVPLKTGTLMLASTSTPPQNAGAMGLREYRLELVFRPNSRS